MGTEGVGTHTLRPEWTPTVDPTLGHEFMPGVCFQGADPELLVRGCDQSAVGGAWYQGAGPVPWQEGLSSKGAWLICTGWGLA